jgi:hypothetical protein
MASLLIAAPSDGPARAHQAATCMQYRADSVIEGGTRDVVRVEAMPAWPN